MTSVSLLTKMRRLINMVHLKYQVMMNRKALQVIIGAGSTKEINWISTNYPILNVTDSKTFTTLFGKLRVQRFLAEHVWEHLSVKDSSNACHNCFDFLVRGGVLRIAVPDGFHPNEDYIQHVKPNGSGPGADDHKVLYNYRTLSEVLVDAGFKVKLLEWFDENGQFHFVNWLPEEGFIKRSTRFDERNRINSTTYTSLIIDAIKV